MGKSGKERCVQNFLLRQDTERGGKERLQECKIGEIFAQVAT